MKTVALYAGSPRNSKHSRRPSTAKSQKRKNGRRTMGIRFFPTISIAMMDTAVQRLFGPPWNDYVIALQKGRSTSCTYTALTD